MTQAQALKQRLLQWLRLPPAWVWDVLILAAGVWLIGALLGWRFLFSGNWPTGGDGASHTFYLWLYGRELLSHGQVTGWVPEVFGGLSFLSYYFPFAFIAIVGLGQLMGEAQAIKLGMFAAAMLLPGAAWLASTRWLKLPRSVALWGVMACLGFLLHEQNSIWGGNLLSTLAGEFTQSYGVLLCLVTLMAWQRCVASGKGWHWVALLEAATGFSNGFALLVTGFATGAFLFDRPHVWRNLRLLLLGHGLAFFMLAGWLWPLFEMHAITIPNDALFEVENWKELLPFPQAVLLALGCFGLAGHALIRAVPTWRLALPWSDALEACLRQAFFMGNAALLSALGFLAAADLGLANIRFFPFVWLFGGIACAWLWGSLLWRLGQALPPIWRWGWPTLNAGLFLAFATVLSLNINQAMDWALWNHSGLQAKPQWQQLSRLFPGLQGDLKSPRLLFEHDPANHDLGSTRTLEALPMFLGGRPVLEGLYMESALLSPAIYQLQSEVSRHPSSPLARFPSGSLDLDQAARHMRFLWANEVLVRHPETVQAFARSPHFEEISQAEPFRVYKLKSFDTHLVDVVDLPLRWLPKAQWMEHSHAWFRSPRMFGQFLPVYSDQPAPALVPAPAGTQVQDFRMSRQSIAWRTDAVGSPHLVRMAWHPKWHLTSPGSLFLAAPGFMLVVPQGPEVRLEFGSTRVGTWGAWASGLAFGAWLLLLLQPLWRGRKSSVVGAAAGAHWPASGLSWRGGSWLWPVLVLCLSVYVGQRHPERSYTQAWDLYRAGDVAQAAQQFDQAYQDRKSKAKKEEALFWSAKAHEQTQRLDLAAERYQMLVDQFHGYWVPEALFTLAQLADKQNKPELAAASRARLVKEYPNDPWTQKLGPRN